jgi:hypothetical protein
MPELRAIIVALSFSRSNAPVAAVSSQMTKSSWRAADVFIAGMDASAGAAAALEALQNPG